MRFRALRAAPFLTRLRPQGWRTALSYAVTGLAGWWVLERISPSRLAEALAGADYPRFLLLMIPNAVLYFLWDTAILTWVTGWFHRPVRYRDLLPVRAVAYVAALVNTELAEGSTAVYLARQAQASVWAVAGTVAFLSLTELTHLALWVAAGILIAPGLLPRSLLAVPLGFGLFWSAVLLWGKRARARAGCSSRAAFRWIPPRWNRPAALLDTFRRLRLWQLIAVILLKVPLLLASLLAHDLATSAFGIWIPLPRLLAVLPAIFLLAALPISVAHLGTTQAGWIYFFQQFAAPSRLLAFSLAAHLTFLLTRALLGLLLLPRAVRELAERPARGSGVVSFRPAQENVVEPSV